MIAIQTKPNTREKLEILSTDAQYDLACACGSSDAERRQRGSNDRWIYPITLPNGGQSVLFRTLITNVCVNDCKYCPLRANQDLRRCVMEPDETVATFMAYYRAREVFGLFLSSGVTATPDRTMDRLIAVARLLRKKEQFRGYLHLKIIPGASDAAITEAVSLASAVSLNIETAGEKHFRHLSDKKNYLQDIIRPIKLISQLTAKGSQFHRVKHTTQFVVGASDECDRELVDYTWGLYRRLELDRVFFSAYQRGLGDASLPGESAIPPGGPVLTREHRLYQVDWLLRKYGFKAEEIPFTESGNLSATLDPKEHWATLHPEQFPVNINRAERLELLRVPGLGPTLVDRILEHRIKNAPLKTLGCVAKINKRLQKASGYLRF